MQGEGVDVSSLPHPESRIILVQVELYIVLVFQMNYTVVLGHISHLVLYNSAY